MIRTGDEYRESIRDGRQVWINGERVQDVPSHPAFRPVVDVRARIYDMAHEEETADAVSYVDEATGERSAVSLKPPRTQADWWDKRAAVDAVLDDIGGALGALVDESGDEQGGNRHQQGECADDDEFHSDRAGERGGLQGEARDMRIVHGRCSILQSTLQCKVNNQKIFRPAKG